MTEPLSADVLRMSDPDRTALFFDFDGTLVEFAERPELVRLAPNIKSDLKRLAGAVDGALAIVTGRDLADIDRFLHPLRLALAGVHGLMQRGLDGAMHRLPVDGQAIALLEDRLSGLIDASPELLLERKPGSLALHYRARPDLEKTCIATMDAAVRDLDGLTLLHGKMVVEAKAGDWNKGLAITRFMAERPFAGRVPFFAGDDVTDEDAFREVNALDGVSVKVGPGETAARYRVDTIAELHERLRELAGFLEQPAGENGSP